MRRFRSFCHSTCKTVLNVLEAVYFRFRKIAVKKITVVKFRVDNRGNVQNESSFLFKTGSFLGQ